MMDSFAIHTRERLCATFNFPLGKTWAARCSPSKRDSSWGESSLRATCALLLPVPPPEPPSMPPILLIDYSLSLTRGSGLAAIAANPQGSHLVHYKRRLVRRPVVESHRAKIGKVQSASSLAAPVGAMLKGTEAGAGRSRAKLWLKSRECGGKQRNREREKERERERKKHGREEILFARHRERERERERGRTRACARAFDFTAGARNSRGTNPLREEES